MVNVVGVEIVGAGVAANLPNLSAALIQFAAGLSPPIPGASRIYIERVNAPFLAAGGTADDFRAGIDRAVSLGWICRHESGTYVKFTENGAALFA